MFVYVYVCTVGGWQYVFVGGRYMANAILKNMDFEESAALEAITYIVHVCATPYSYQKYIHIFIHTYKHTC